MHETSDVFFGVIKIYVICLVVAIVLFNVARLAERRAFDAGEHSGAFVERMKHTFNEDQKAEEING